MNSRQKAKYYKKKLNQLLAMQVPKAIICPKHIETFHVCKYVPGDIVLQDSKKAEKLIIEEMADLLSKEILKYANFDTYYDIDYDRYKVVADVTLVEPVYRDWNIFLNWR